VNDAIRFHYPARLRYGYTASAALILATGLVLTVTHHAIKHYPAWYFVLMGLIGTMTAVRMCLAPTATLTPQGIAIRTRNFKTTQLAWHEIADVEIRTVGTGREERELAVLVLADGTRTPLVTVQNPVRPHSPLVRYLAWRPSRDKAFPTKVDAIRTRIGIYGRDTAKVGT